MDHSYWWTSKPPPGVEIDWSRPISRGLSFLTLAGGDHRRDLVNGKMGTKLTSGIWDARRTRIGPGVASTSNTTGGVYFPYPSRLPTSLPAFTILVWLMPMAAFVADSKILMIAASAGATWTTPFEGLGLGIGVSGGTPRVYGSDASNERLSDGTSGHYTQLTLSCNVVRWDYTGVTASSSAEFFLNGRFVEVGSVGMTSPVSLVNRREIALMNRSGLSTGEGVQGVMPMAAIWSRALSAAEIAEVYANPYGMFAPPVWRRYFIPQAGGGAPATSDVAALRAGTKLASAGAKASSTTVNARAGGRIATASARAATATVAVDAGGRIATATIKGGIGVPSERAAGILAAVGAHAGTTTANERAAGRLATAGTHAGATTASERATGLLASAGAHAGATSASARALSRLATLATRAVVSTAAMLGFGRLATAASKAASATTSERASGLLATATTTARTSTTSLRSMAQLRASSVPTYDQTAGIRAIARMTAIGVKDVSGAAALRAGGRLAGSGARAASGQSVTAVGGRMAVAVVRGAASAATLRGSAILGADGVPGHVAAVAISAQGSATIFTGIVIIPTRASALDQAYTGASASDAAYVGAGAGDLALVGAVGSDSEV